MNMKKFRNLKNHPVYVYIQFIYGTLILTVYLKNAIPAVFTVKITILNRRKRQ